MISSNFCVQNLFFWFSFAKFCLGFAENSVKIISWDANNNNFKFLWKQQCACYWQKSWNSLEKLEKRKKISKNKIGGPPNWRLGLQFGMVPHFLAAIKTAI